MKRSGGSKRGGGRELDPLFFGTIIAFEWGRMVETPFILCWELGTPIPLFKNCWMTAPVTSSARCLTLCFF
jgi:hypothetical protein